MGMDFGDGPDFDAIKEEREKAKKGSEKNVELTEDDCWEHMIFVQKYEPVEDDDGMREILRNTLTGKHRMKKKIGTKQLDPHNNTPVFTIWDWDGDAYAV